MATKATATKAAERHQHARSTPCPASCSMTSRTLSGLREIAADELGVLIGLEVAHPHDHGIGVLGGSDHGDTAGQQPDEVVGLVVVVGGQLLDPLAGLAVLELVEAGKRQRVDLDGVATSSGVLRAPACGLPVKLRSAGSIRPATCQEAHPCGLRTRALRMRGSRRPRGRAGPRPSRGGPRGSRLCPQRR